MAASTDKSASERFDPAALTRPDEALLAYYTLCSALALVFFPIVWIPLYFRYRTLRYAFDDEGVSVSWGILFKREVILTYRRIQDIHVHRPLFMRWLGIAKLAVQTASGASGAEMTIEGVRHPEKLRDFLYSQMRGAREDEQGDSGGAANAPSDETLALLTEIRDILRSRQGAGGSA